MTPPPASRRKWFRLSLRTLMVLILVVGCGLGWFLRGVRIQRDAVAKLREAGGYVRYDWEKKLGHGEVRDDAATGPNTPRWLVDLLGFDAFGHPVEVNLDRSSTGYDAEEAGSSSGDAFDRLMVDVGRLAGLEELNVTNSSVTDAGLAQLAGLKNLKSLDLSFCQEIGDAGLIVLKPLTQLQELDLSRTYITDAGLKHLSKLTRLETLKLNEIGATDLDDRQMESDERMRKFGHERARREMPKRFKITDLGLSQLRRLTRLRWLGLSDSHMTDAGLEHLETMARLEVLDLGGTEVTDVGIARLERMTSLDLVGLERTRTGDVGAHSLAKLKKLRTLYISGTQISDVALT